MKKWAPFLLILSILVTCCEPSAQAQLNRRQIKKNNRGISSYRGRKSTFGKEKVYNSVGVALNGLNYYGDLAPTPKKISTDLGFTRPGLGLTFVHRFGPRYQLQASFLYGTLRGSDVGSADPGDLSNGVFRYQRNLSFRNNIKELSAVAVFDLFENQATYISRTKWTPYAYLGAAVFHNNPQAKVPATDLAGNPFPNAGEWISLQPLGTEGQYADLAETDVNYGIEPYSRIQFAIPFGIGARLRLNEVLDLSGEFGFRYLFTDYVDDVSHNYVNLDLLASDLARAMSYRTNEVRGDPPNDDGISYNYGTYRVWAGYGLEAEDNKRGNSGDRDVYTVTTVRLTYIIGKNFHRAKFR